MVDITLEVPNEYSLIEVLAQEQHVIWAHWMTYMFSQGMMNQDGSWTMPEEKVERWTRQENTPYSMLSEQEKESARDVARRVLAAMEREGFKVLATKGWKMEIGTIGGEK